MRGHLTCHLTCSRPRTNTQRIQSHVRSHNRQHVGGRPSGEHMDTMIPHLYKAWRRSFLYVSFAILNTLSDWASPIVRALEMVEISLSLSLSNPLDNIPVRVADWIPFGPNTHQENPAFTFCTFRTFRAFFLLRNVSL